MGSISVNMCVFLSTVSLDSALLFACFFCLIYQSKASPPDSTPVAEYSRAA